MARFRRKLHEANENLYTSIEEYGNVTEANKVTSAQLREDKSFISGLEKKMPHENMKHKIKSGVKAGFKCLLRQWDIQ